MILSGVSNVSTEVATPTTAAIQIEKFWLSSFCAKVGRLEKSFARASLNRGA
jgi:hypothetical protein